MSARDIVMANKLKEGVQDALVYLRLLEGAKLAPVYERKRVQLMAKLLDLQGDARKEAPPKLDDDSEDEDDAISEESPKHDAPDGTPEKKVTPERRNSRKLDDIKNKFNQPSGKGAGYRYKTLEELKKESAMKKAGVRSDSVSEEPTEEEKEDNIPQPTAREKTPPPPAVDPTPSDNQVEELTEEDEDLPPSSDPTPTVVEPVEQEKKGRSHTLGSGLIGKIFKGGKGKDRSLSIPDTGSTDNISQLSAENSTITLDEEEQGEGEEEEEPGKFTSHLERVTRRLGKYNYQKVTATLDNDTFHFIKPKDKSGTTLSLVGAATAIRDSYQFELHTVDKSYTFRTDSEDLCIKWVDLLKGAIDACSPPQEEPAQEEIEEEIEEEAPVPQITVSADNTDNGLVVPEGSGGNIRESLSYENVAFGKKKKQEMPDASSIQVKGFIYKKGTFGWDKVWIVLTYDNTLFMSPNDTSKKVLQVIPITPDTKVEKKASPDKKYPHGLIISCGKMKETLATDSKNDFDVWLSFLNQASGSGDIQELLSEDEDGGELYEELELKDEPSPGIPVSPRPNHTSFAPPTGDIEEELYDDFDGDIYEGLDDLDIPETVKRSPPPVASIPSLPRRNDPKITPPTLPPRNQPQEPVPSLPPRLPKGVTAAMDYEAPLPSPKQKSIPTQPIDDEIYDDVMGAGQGVELEETYDDVVSTQAKMTANRVSSGDLYEDMVVPSSVGESTVAIEEEQEEYCDMILPQHVTTQEEDPDELYVDVEQPPPSRPPPPVTSTTTSNTSSTNTAAKTSIPSRPPPPATAGTRPPPPKTNTPTQSPLLKQRSDESPVLGKKTISPTTEPKASTLPKNAQSPSAVARSLAKTGGGAKRMSTGPSKVAELSKKFGDAPSQGDTSPKNKRGTHSGTILYMGPGKTAYSSDWCVLEGTTLIFYKGPNEKLSHFRLSTKEAELHMGQPDGKGSPFSFYIKKGSLVHKFSTNTLEELGDWIGPIAHVIPKVFPPPDCLYQAKDDHNEEGGVSFKKDDIVWVLGQDTPTKWVGVVGKTVNEFTGAHGTFPSNKIGQLSQNEAMYI